MADDRSLLERFLRGDHAAFNELMHRHEDRIFAVALRMTGDRNDALEATQDTFVTLFRKAETWRGDAALSTWLHRVAVNACNDLLRRRQRLPVPQEDPIDQPSTGAGVEEIVTLRTDLAQALADLPDEYKDAVVLSDLAGLPYEEIASVLGVPLGTVKSRISRGRRRLALFLEQAPPTEPSKETT